MTHTQSIQKLADSAPYMKFIAVVMYATCIFTTLTLVGILWSWVYLWFGYVLWSGATALQKGVADEDEASIELGCKQVYGLFKLAAIFTAIGLVIFVLYIAAVIIFLVSGGLDSP